MSSCRNAIAALLAAACVLPAWAQDKFPGIGRAATPAEVKAWDIDVRPDFKGLPSGSGSVDQGQEIWESKCASCHGVFGESNSVFNPLVGGTTKDDVKTGHVATLKRTDYPGRTTLMKVPTVSTLWDYINRAMPWNAPKSLKPDEVYAVTAYLLNLGDVLPADFTLSDKNIAEVQKLMPNRNGMTTRHAMWPGKEFGAGKTKPDTQAKACMSHCEVPVDVSSRLPEHAADAWGNLRDQNRLVGPQRGEVTVDDAKSGAAKPSAADPLAAAAVALTQKHGCVACHGMTAKLVGPGFAEVAKKHAGQADYLAGKIVSGGEGVWGNVPMPAQTLSPDDAKAIASWLAAGAKAP
ncbi:MAG: c-type cytochrome [Proteobacteria bacterium]|nr:c-type cytochrome [Pseudomonadota bacterium]